MSKSVDHAHSPESRDRSFWLRMAEWIGFGLVITVVVVVVLIVILLNSPRFHTYLIHLAEVKAGENLGVRVELQNFTLHLSTLSADLYGITVHGANPYPDPPLLQISHVEAGVRVVSILHGAWYLNDLRIDQPVARIYVDSRGVSNLPVFKSSGNSKSHLSVFDLDIRHLLLDRGDIDANDRPTNLTADLHDLEIRATFNKLMQEYSGRLAYTDGRIDYGAFQPVKHSFEAHFKATPSQFDLTESKITFGDSRLAVDATLQNYDHPDVRAKYNFTIDGGQIARILDDPSIPRGMFRATGSLQYQRHENQPLLESISLDGDLISRRLEIKASSIRAGVDNVVAHYSVANGNATLRDLRASILGGELTAQGNTKKIGGNSHSELAAAVHGVSLDDLTRAMGHSARIREVSMHGRLDADVRASWGKTLHDLVAHTNATINGQVQRGPGNAGPNSIPVESAIHANYDGRNREFALNGSYVRTTDTNLTMNGVVSSHSRLNVRLQADDLREFETIADVFRPSTGGLGLAGRATFEGTVQGSTAAPHLMGQLTATNLHLNGTVWKVLRTNVDLSPSHASLQNANLESALRGRVTFSASTGLTKWSFTKTSPVRIQLKASQLSISDVARLANRTMLITGTLNAGISLRGSELNPSGNGDLVLTKVTAFQQPVQSAKMTFSGTGSEVHGDLAIKLPAGTVQGTASIDPKQNTYTADFTASGIELNELQAIREKGIDATGVLAATLKGQGALNNPQLDVNLQIPRLSIQGQAATGINLHMNVANHVADATLESSAVNTSIKAKARVSLTGDYVADATLDTGAIPLQPLIAVYAPEFTKLSGETEVHATLHGPLKKKQMLTAHVTVPVMKIAYGSTVQLAAVSPIRMDYEKGIISLQHSSIQGTDTNLEFQGSIPTGGQGPMSLVLLGTVNLKLVQLFDPDVTSSGEVRFNINTQGATDQAAIGGQVAIVNASFASGQLPVGLENGNGELTLTRDRISIRGFQGTVGGGTLTAQGGVTYSRGIEFDLGLTAKGVRMLYPEGLREEINANLRLSGSKENAFLGGSVELSNLSFTPAFDLTSFIGNFSSGVTAPPSRGFTQNLQLDLAVHSTNNVNLTSRTLSIDGSANLQLRGTAANPVVLGRINLNSGDVILKGDRFVLNGGTVQFVNPSETQPVVNLNLTTTIQQYNINLRFRGPVDQLRTEYNSNPALPQADIINLLAFGTTSEASAATATPANQAAESLVASQVSSQVTSRISKIAGISQLSINPVLAGGSGQGPAGANITIQQRVTGNLFITFSTNVATTQGQTIQGQYQVSPRVAVSATRDPNGGFALDTLIKKSW